MSDLDKARAYLDARDVSDEQRATEAKKRKILGSLDEAHALTRYERDRGSADTFWLVLGTGAVALSALTFLFPILVWPLVVFAAVWMVVAVVSIPFALWLGRRIGGAR